MCALQPGNLFQVLVNAKALSLLLPFYPEFFVTEIPVHSLFPFYAIRGFAEDLRDTLHFVQSAIAITYLAARD